MKLNSPPVVADSPLVRLGAWTLILAVVQFFVFHLMVQFAWPEPYSWAHNNISDLGAVGCGPWEGDGRYVCSPLHAWMNASFVIQGVLLITSLILTRPLWHSFLTTTSRVFIFLAGLGWILAGVAPADVNEGLHVLAAFLVFFCGNIGLLYAERAGRGEETWTVRAYSLSLGAIGLVATALFMGEVWFIFGMGGMERLVVFPLQVWAVLTGTFLLRPWSKESFIQPDASR